MTSLNDSLSMAKAALRERIAETRRNLPEEQRMRAGSAIARELSSEPNLRGAEAVGLFAGMADEPDTRPIFDQLRARGAALYFPRCAPGRQLEWCRVDAWGDLRPGRYGLREPASGLEPIPSAALQCVLVPGVAFDREGRRLGRGAGYYDRAFPMGEGGPALLGVAFSFQLVDEVPAGRLDRRMGAVVTEEAIIRVESTGAD